MSGRWNPLRKKEATNKNNPYAEWCHLNPESIAPMMDRRTTSIIHAFPRLWTNAGYASNIEYHPSRFYYQWHDSLGHCHAAKEIDLEHLAGIVQVRIYNRASLTFDLKVSERFTPIEV